MTRPSFISLIIHSPVYQLHPSFCARALSMVSDLLSIFCQNSCGRCSSCVMRNMVLTQEFGGVPVPHWRRGSTVVRCHAPCVCKCLFDSLSASHVACLIIQMPRLDALDSKLELLALALPVLKQMFPNQFESTNGVDWPQLLRPQQLSFQEKCGFSIASRYLCWSELAQIGVCPLRPYGPSC